MISREKRRIYPLVNRSVQYKLTAYILVYCFAIVVVLSTALFLPDILAHMDESLSPDKRLIASERILSLHSRIWPAVIALVFLVGLHFWRISHRVIGALHHLRLSFERIMEGDLSFRVKLRKGDYLHQEANVFNTMMDQLEGKWQAVRRAGLDTLMSFEEIERYLEKTGKQKLVEDKLISSHRQNLEALIYQSEFFTLSKCADENSPGFNPDCAADIVAAC